MSKVSINFSGEDILESATPQVDDIRKAVYQEVLQSTPVKTGRLKRSTRLTEDGIEVGEEYGAYVEYRTNYLTNAINRFLARFR